MEGILVFAADHRQNIEWNLPYIRLGNFQSDAILNIKYDKEIEPFQLLLAEGAQLWWIAKHLNEIGNPKYVALMHYRRFFTALKNQKSPIINCPIDLFQPAFALEPLTMYMMMETRKLDILSIVPNVPTQDGTKADNAKDQLKLDIKNWNVYISDELIDDAFKLFFENCADANLKSEMEKAMVRKAHFNCNILCLKQELLKEYVDILVPTFKAIKEKYDAELSKMASRTFGYILERFTSLYLFGSKAIGRTIGATNVVSVKKKEEFDTYKF